LYAGSGLALFGLSVSFRTTSPLEPVQHNMAGRVKARHASMIYTVYFQNCLLSKASTGLLKSMIECCYLLYSSCCHKKNHAAL